MIINACKKYGKPEIIRTDNEHVFTSVLFKACLWFLGIKHQATEISSPWQNGRIERLFGTLKEKLRQATLKNITTDQLLSDFRFYYNFCRPHQHLKGLTPAEAWTNKSQRETRRKKSYWYEGWGGELRGIFIPPDE